jgi:microcystin degradation protein MlrC
MYSTVIGSKSRQCVKELVIGKFTNDNCETHRLTSNMQQARVKLGFPSAVRMGGGNVVINGGLCMKNMHANMYTKHGSEPPTVSCRA